MNRYLAILWFCMTLLTSCVHTEVEINGSIAGFVREKGTAKAIGGCSISIEPGNNQIYSSEDGSYSFTGLQMGDYTLTASKSGYEILTETITIGAGKTLNHDVMLTPARAPMVSTDSVTNLSMELLLIMVAQRLPKEDFIMGLIVRKCLLSIQLSHQIAFLLLPTI